MERVLVTGATGFAGGALCRRLVETGHAVVAFVRAGSDDRALRELGVEVRGVDITNGAAVQGAFEPFERVFHVAAAYRTEHADRDVFERVNVGATRHLLEAARRAGVGRFVHTSTVGVQGAIEDAPADEDYRFAPRDHYQRSKLEGERLARAAFNEGMPGVIVRPVGLYGPGDRRYLKLFRAVARGRFVMIGSGRTLRHMTHVDDLVDGMLLASTHSGAVGRVYTIGGAENPTLREVVDTIADAVGRPRVRWHVPFAPVYAASVVCDRACRLVGVSPPLYPRRVNFFRIDRAFTIERARRELGYAPRYDLRSGIEHTARWYRERGWI